MILPFLKWPGGKRWLIHGHGEAFLPVDGTYFEPFLGAGAAFFMTQPARAVLSDSNGNLINVYQQVRHSPARLQRALSHYQERHSEKFYYKERRKTYDCPFRRAAQFIYLNRTCFNGIYRVNLNGEFNVPKGTRDGVVMDTDDFAGSAASLRKAELVTCSFERTIARAKKGDFVYADPPYTVKHNMNGFVKYNDKLFQWADQEKLNECLAAASDRGVHVLVSNANHESIASLYNGGWQHHIVSRSSIISGGAQHRGATTELLISNYEIPWRAAQASLFQFTDRSVTARAVARNA